MRQLGYRVLRICNADVYNNLDSTLDALLAFIEAPR
jgi:very-short-patch-repair endonuclease